MEEFPVTLTSVEMPMEGIVIVADGVLANRAYGRRGGPHLKSGSVRNDAGGAHPNRRHCAV